MSNVHGLFSGKKKGDDEEDDSNNRYVGGIGDHGGGSGLAVQPNIADEPPAGQPPPGSDAIFGMAENAGTLGDGEQIRRTITMYRDGFTVDDGPYRRLDDRSNAEFLRSLAAGRTPRELTDESGGDVVVGLVDKRTEDYVETFQSFSGTGASLGTSTNNTEGVSIFDPNTLPEPSTEPPAGATTSIAVRLLNGKRKIVKLGLNNTVTDLATHLRNDSDGESFRLAAGFPPKPIEDATATIDAAGLKGAQVSMQKP